MFEVKHVPQVWFNAVYLHTANVQLTFFFPLSSRFRNNVKNVQITISELSLTSEFKEQLLNTDKKHKVIKKQKNKKIGVCTKWYSQCSRCMGGGMLEGGREVLSVGMIVSDQIWQARDTLQKALFLIYPLGCDTTHFSLLLRAGCWPKHHVVIRARL